MTVRDYSGIVAAAYDHLFDAEPHWDQAFYEHRLRANGGRALEPGGEALIPVSAAADGEQPIADWRERCNAHLPEQDARVVVHERTRFAPAAGVLHWHLRWEVGRPGQPKEVSFRHHRLRRYRSDELRALLAGAGFVGISARRGYTEPQSSDPADELVYSARRPSGR